MNFLDDKLIQGVLGTKWSLGKMTSSDKGEGWSHCHLDLGSVSQQNDRALLHKDVFKTLSTFLPHLFSYGWGLG